MAELKFQKELKEVTHLLGGWSETLSHRFKHGMPDLIWKLNKLYPLTMVECKEKKLSENTRTEEFAIETTALQKNCLRILRDLGVTVGVIVKVYIGREQRLYIAPDVDSKIIRVNKDEYYLKTMKINNKLYWPIDSITKDLIRRTK